MREITNVVLFFVFCAKTFASFAVKKITAEGAKEYNAKYAEAVLVKLI